MLSIPTARLGNRLVLDPRPLIPLLVAWGAAMAVIGLEGDIGFAALLFTLFIAMLWITTGRFGYLVLGVVLFAVGAYIAARYFGQVHIRVDRVAGPVADRDQHQRRRGPAAAGRGTGSAPGASVAPGSASTIQAGNIPELTTDMIFAAIGTEMGLVGIGARSSSPSSSSSARASASPRRRGRTSRGSWRPA